MEARGHPGLASSGLAGTWFLAGGGRWQKGEHKRTVRTAGPEWTFVSSVTASGRARGACVQRRVARVCDGTISCLGAVARLQGKAWIPASVAWHAWVRSGTKTSVSIRGTLLRAEGHRRRGHPLAATKTSQSCTGHTWLRASEVGTHGTETLPRLKTYLQEIVLTIVLRDRRQRNPGRRVPQESRPRGGSGGGRLDGRGDTKLSYLVGVFFVLLLLHMPHGSCLSMSHLGSIDHLLITFPTRLGAAPPASSLFMALVLHRFRFLPLLCRRCVGAHSLKGHSSGVPRLASKSPASPTGANPLPGMRRPH